jgi:hypothetical protein
MKNKLWRMVPQRSNGYSFDNILDKLANHAIVVREVASPGPFRERLLSTSPVLRCLRQPFSLLSHTCNPRSFIYLRTLFRDDAPATRLESAASTLFLSSQGVAPAKGHFLFSSTYPKRTNHESASTQFQLGRDAG